MMKRCPNRSWNWVSWLPHPVSTWGCMSWWWWNTDCTRAFHSRYTSSLPHWTHHSHQSSSSMVPLPLRSFRLEDIPIFYCCPCGCGSLTWFASHSSIPCTCSHPRCDNKWEYIQVRNESHPASSFCNFAIKHSEELVSSYLSSLFHRVHEFRQRLFSLTTEFMTIPLVFDISLIPRLASYDDILLHPCRVGNSFTGRLLTFTLLALFSLLVV